jgi:hypothetical protein
VHLAALTTENAKNERIIACAAPYNWNQILAIMRQAYPDRSFAEDIPNEGHDLRKVSNDKAVELLQAIGQSGWTSLEESVKKTLEDL